LRVLVVGAGGMVGRAVDFECKSRGDEVFARDHESLNITDLNLVRRELSKLKPDAVINCAAWTDVDGCENDPGRAQAENAAGPENLAVASRETGAVLVTISTDYVFAGEKEGFYTQRDDPNPTSAYGKSKLDGERRAQLASARTIVVRSGFIYGPGGRNFLSTVAERLRREEQVGAIADAWGTPTYSAHLAARLRDLAQLDLPGIYHVVNSGPGVSFEEFSRAAADDLSKTQSLVHGVLSNTLTRPAPRPRNSRLQCLLSAAIGLDPLPSWREAVRSFLAETESPGTATP
jgi:dTDP-4-dehydrorhamnose reductase